MTYHFTSLTIPLTVEAPKPLPGPLAPLDKRHRWLYIKTNTHGDFRYQCQVCHRWKTITPIVNLLARKMRDAAHNLDEHLSAITFPVNTS